MKEVEKTQRFEEITFIHIYVLVIILNVFHNGFLMNVNIDLVYPNNKLNK